MTSPLPGWMSAFARREVLLTGAAGGIGSAMAEDLASAGARLWLVDRDAAALEALAARLAPAARATVCDLARPADRREIAAAVASGAHRVDALVLAAGSTVRTWLERNPALEPAWEGWLAAKEAREASDARPRRAESAAGRARRSR